MNLLALAITLALTQGETAVLASFTPPREWVERICTKTGADLTLALEERDEAAKAMTKLVFDLIPPTEFPDTLTGFMGMDAEAKGASVATLGMKANETISPLVQPNFLELGLMVYRIFGKSAATRMFTIPQNVLKDICAKSGADYAQALEDRNHATEEIMEFLESVLVRSFHNPDPK